MRTVGSSAVPKPELVLVNHVVSAWSATAFRATRYASSLSERPDASLTSDSDGQVPETGAYDAVEPVDKSRDRRSGAIMLIICILEIF